MLRGLAAGLQLIKYVCQPADIGIELGVRPFTRVTNNKRSIGLMIKGGVKFSFYHSDAA